MLYKLIKYMCIYHCQKPLLIVLFLICVWQQVEKIMRDIYFLSQGSVILGIMEPYKIVKCSHQWHDCSFSMLIFMIKKITCAKYKAFFRKGKSSFVFFSFSWGNDTNFIFSLQFKKSLLLEPQLICWHGIRFEFVKGW